MENTFEAVVVILLLAIMAEIYLLTKPKKNYETKQISMLVDTSVLMDGRVVDLARTGFLLGQVIVPKSVLAEMQFLADGADHAKRERARLGMDAVKDLQDILQDSFKLLPDSPRTANGVDERLILLAKETDSAILTLDYNLNKVAQVEGVQVLNINELAKSLRMVHLPGDEIDISLTQKGQSSDQAVGYLSDGTMVVVEQAKKYIGKDVKVEIIRSLQTDAGKMMFAKLVSSTQTKNSESSKKTVSDNRKNNSHNDKSKTPHSSNRSNQEKGRRPSASSNANTSRANVQRRRPKTSAQHEAELIRLADNQQD